MFSARTAWDRTENPLTRALAAARASGEEAARSHGVEPDASEHLDQSSLIAQLGDPRGTLYEPSPLGHPDARAAVARYYRERGIAVDPGHVVISASTSESYGWLLRLLADEGDTVLAPQPSYPLFSWLAVAESVRLLPYRLLSDAGWSIDMDELRRTVESEPRARAILAVHPNNPTGAFARRREAEALCVLAERRGLGLVVDEVFGDYAFGELAEDRLPSFADLGDDKAPGERPLTFVLSGLSKVLLLPQCKLAWTVVLGPPALVREALARLELIADTYLSPATPTQLALPALLHARAGVQAALRARLAANLHNLDAAIEAMGPSCPVRRLPVDGGWYAILEVPRQLDEDGWVELLVSQERVIVHPGHFFDFDCDGFLVVSLLPEPAVFHEGARRALGALAR